MRFAVIAGGEGSRLRHEGIDVPKPLVRICGQTLLERWVRLFAEVGADEVVMLLRRGEGELRLEAERAAAACGIRLTLREAVTPSSMHSLYALAEDLRGLPFCLTTIDTVFSADSFRSYVHTFLEKVGKPGCDGLMGVTRLIDDERPLYVEVDDEMYVRGFHNTVPSPYISAGIYGLTEHSLDVLEQCIKRGESRLRNFQRAMLADGMSLLAYDMGQVIDVDHADDIRKAENLLS